MLKIKVDICTFFGKSLFQGIEDFIAWRKGHWSVHWSICKRCSRFDVNVYGRKHHILSIDLAKDLKVKSINRGPSISLKTVTVKIKQTHRKLCEVIKFDSRTFERNIYVTDITDQCILGLKFLLNFLFTVDMERNEIRTNSKEIFYWHLVQGT